MKKNLGKCSNCNKKGQFNVGGIVMCLTCAMAAISPPASKGLDASDVVQVKHTLGFVEVSTVE